MEDVQTFMWISVAPAGERLHEDLLAQREEGPVLQDSSRAALQRRAEGLAGQELQRVSARTHARARARTHARRKNASGNLILSYFQRW